MFNFTFQNLTKIIFGKDTIGQIAGEIPRNAEVLNLLREILRLCAKMHGACALSDLFTIDKKREFVDA